VLRKRNPAVHCRIKGSFDASVAHGDLLAQDDINAELKLWPAAADFL
jgi:hypothetical protein